jgi:predicted O-methyltransferase YrrM
MSSADQRYPRLHLESAERNLHIAAPPFERSDSFRSLVSAALAAAADAEPGLAPAPNPCALQPDTLAFLGALLTRAAPSTIVEFGSGESTIALADWAMQHRSRLISVEHDRSWFERIGSRLSDAQRAVTDLRHAPLRLIRSGLRSFLTYEDLPRLSEPLRGAQFVLLDGPHMSGREAVFYATLSFCPPGALIVLDDFRYYAVREMLADVPASVARCFVAEPIEENSHGLYVIRCERSPGEISPPRVGLRSVARSYWRCWRDVRRYGTGRAA